MQRNRPNDQIIKRRSINYRSPNGLKSRFQGIAKGMLLKGCIIFLFVILTLPACKREKTGSSDNYVILVSLDGFRWDYDRKYKTPNLYKLATDGVKADRMIPSFPVKTFPNHYSIATGLYPDHHGIIHNNFYAPDLGLFYRLGDRASIENPSFYGGEPVWVTARKQNIITAVYYWVGSEAPVNGLYPDYWKKYEDNFDFHARIDTVAKWLNYPAEKRPHLIALYFPEPDATGSRLGPDAPETRAMVEVIDSMIGLLRKRLAELPIAKRINFILVSDHGMGSVSRERYVNLSEVVPERMIKKMTGSIPVFFIDPFEGKKDSILSLINSATGVKAWSKHNLPEHFHFGTNKRIPEIIVMADSSWILNTRPIPPNIRSGAHGYDISNTDMHAIFYAEGPSFRKNYRFNKLYNVDIYNLVCRLLNITPATNDGDPSRIEGMLR